MAQGGGRGWSSPRASPAWVLQIVRGPLCSVPLRRPPLKSSGSSQVSFQGPTVCFPPLELPSGRVFDRCEEESAGATGARLLHRSLLGQCWPPGLALPGRNCWGDSHGPSLGRAVPPCSCVQQRRCWDRRRRGYTHWAALVPAHAAVYVGVWHLLIPSG